MPMGFGGIFTPFLLLVCLDGFHFRFASLAENQGVGNYLKDLFSASFWACNSMRSFFFSFFQLL